MGYFRRAFIFITLCVFFKTLYSQTDSSLHYFKQIGWTINILPDFKSVDSTTTVKNTAKGKAMVESTMKRDVNMSHLINLVNVSKNKFNNLVVNLTNASSITEQNWETVDKSAKDIFYKTFVTQMSNSKIDSAFSSKLIDGVDFRTFNVDISVNSNIVIRTCYMTTFYKGMYFAITYVYTNDIDGKEILSMIDESKFDK